jgi:hypothetical protein
MAYIVDMAGPASARFDPAVAVRLAAFVATHPGLSASAATNLLVDEALRSQEHPLVVFRDGPAGRRARLIGGPDVWEVVRAVRGARKAEPDLDAEEVVALVSGTTGVPDHLIRAAVDYWADHPDDVDAGVARADAEIARPRSGGAESSNSWPDERPAASG